MTTKGKELVVKPVSEYAVVLSPEAMTSYLEETLAPGEQISLSDLPTIKVPAGGGQVWEQPSGEATKTLDCIIIHRQLLRAYWGSEFSGEGSAPDCSSLDAVHGHGKFEGQACATCPMAQWGSKGDNAQACRLITRLFLLFPDSMFPTILRVPPSSYNACKRYILTDLHAAGYPPYHQVVTRVGLREVKSGGGIKYSEVTFSPVAEVPQDTLHIISAYRERMLPFLTSVPVTNYGQEGDADDGAFG